MPKSAVITLTTAGTDTGPFNLLSDVDSYVSPFESNIAKSSLVAGYTTNLVPDAATIIRVQSTSSLCSNYIDLNYPTTTTTTTTSTTTTTTTAPTTTTTTSTTTTTTTSGVTAELEVFGESSGSDIIFTVNVVSGTTLDNLVFDGEVQRYSDLSCSTTINPECAFSSVTLSTGNSTVSSGALCSVGSSQSLKVITLQVNSTNITSSPEDITVGSNTYRITGFNVCGGL